MKAALSIIAILLTVFSCGNAFALTYLPEDAARGGMWANVLVDASDEFKDDEDSFNTGGGWSDPHNLLGAIPENQDPYSPKHSSIVTMNNGADSWAILSFADGYGNLLAVQNDPTNPGGCDAIVWGNAFYSGGSPIVWSEPGTIYLSQDGVTWWQLPQTYFGDRYDSSADGVSHQTFDHTPGEGEGLVSPGAPWAFDEYGNHTSTGLAGGDAFDMSTAFYVGDWTDPGDDNPDLVGLEWFSYILLTGESQVDIASPLYSGPDPDSVYVFSTALAPVPVPAGVWLLGSGFTALAGLHRRLHK